MVYIGVKWTAEQEKTLRELWGKGATQTEIAVELGYPFTRNSVAGKIDRLGISKDAPADKIRKGRPRNLPTIPHGFMHTPSGPILRRTVHFNPSITQLPRCEAIDILELKDHHCRWPIDGDGPMRYCGLDKVNGSSYCGEHHMISTETIAQLRTRVKDYYDVTPKHKHRKFKY